MISKVAVVVKLFSQTPSRPRPYGSAGQEVRRGSQSYKTRSKLKSTPPQLAQVFQQGQVRKRDLG